jgi:hypothetical protein
MESRFAESATVLRHPATESSDVERKLRKRELKQLLQDGARPLNAWEQYRALNDAMDEAYDVTDISNREARFSLLVMGILNAFVVIAAGRPDVVAALAGPRRTVAAVLLGIYVVTAVYFVFQAIEALRPGRSRSPLDGWTSSNDFPVGIRYYEDVIQRDVHSHWRAWGDVHMAQLNAELAVQHHSMCLRSNVKRAALHRLYAGLQVMTLLVVGLIVLFVSAVWF